MSETCVRTADQQVTAYGATVAERTDHDRFVPTDQDDAAYREAVRTVGPYGTVARNADGTFIGAPGVAPAPHPDVLLLRTYHANPAPTAAESVAALKALMRVVGRILA